MRSVSIQQQLQEAESLQVDSPPRSLEILDRLDLDRASMTYWQEIWFAAIKGFALFCNNQQDKAHSHFAQAEEYHTWNYSHFFSLRTQILFPRDPPCITIPEGGEFFIAVITLMKEEIGIHSGVAAGVTNPATSEGHLLAACGKIGGSLNTSTVIREPRLYPHTSGETTLTYKAFSCTRAQYLAFVASMGQVNPLFIAYLPSKEAPGDPWTLQRATAADNSPGDVSDIRESFRSSLLYETCRSTANRVVKKFTDFTRTHVSSLFFINPPRKTRVQGGVMDNFLVMPAPHHVDLNKPALDAMYDQLLNLYHANTPEADAKFSPLKEIFQKTLACFKTPSASLEALLFKLSRLRRQISFA